MKSLLVSARLVENESYPEARDALDVRWGSFLNRASLYAVMVPSQGAIAPYFEQLEPAGLLLTGGNDLSAVADDPLSKLRDARELELIEMAGKAGLPVLGVCRGLQLIASEQGYQLKPVSGHVACEHSISISPDTRFLGDYEGIDVNSYHGHGVWGDDEEFIVAARSDDGGIEALEHRTRATLGIMWHPERYAVPRECDLQLFRRFFDS